MSRTASVSLDHLDPDIQEAVHDAARRAGVPLDEWVSATIAGSEERPAPADATPAGMADDHPHPSETAGRRSERHRTRASRSRPEPGLGEAVAAISRRLDDLDSRLAHSGDAAAAAVTRAVAGLEVRLRDAAGGGSIEAALKDLEQRLAALDGRTNRRQAGRGPRALQDDLRSAVVTIRRRQDEIDAGSGGRAAPTVAAPATALAGLRGETARLRDNLARQATGRDVAALEEAVRTLMGELLRVRAPADLAAVTGPLDLMRSQVERLAGEVAAGTHARLAGEIERLAGRIASTLAAAEIAGGDAADLSHSLDAARRQVAGLADPERVRVLAESVRELGAEVTRLRAGMAESPPAAGTAGERSPAVETRRADPDPGPVATAGIEPAGAAGPAPGPLARIDAVSAKADRLAAPPLAGGDLASIHGMLRSLADKLDRVETGGSGESLDGLERQVLTLVSRLESRAGDPTLAGLERTMGELLAQVALLRDEAPIEAAVERAARQAIAGAIEAAPRVGVDAGQVAALQSALADLKTQHSASDRRIHATMEGVHGALERLVASLAQVDTSRADTSRVDPARAESAEVPIPDGTARRDSVLRETTALAGRGAPRRPEPGRPAPAAAPRVAAEEILEPGASRPRPGQAAPDAAPALDPATDVKASFIAAARRAAQTAAAEASGERAGATAEAGRRRAPGTRTGALNSLRASIDRHRRPLLLGLAAVVLVLGAFQAMNAYVGRTRDEAPRPVAAERTAPAPGPAPTTARAPAPEPATTQSIGPKSAPATAQAPTDPPAPARSPVPAVRDMAALGGDLAKLPGDLSALREAALASDGAAAYEVASRAADGLGLPKDPALAAKLFERLAGHGYAPAQYRLASQYEKGAGVTRDAAQARRWYGKAAEQGHARAMHNLAVMLAEASSADGKPDYAAAASWFRRAAELGVRDSQYNLAVLLARGLGVPQDLAQSYGWFSAAAGQGDEDAGRKRDEVAGKMTPKDLAAARAAAEAWKPRQPDPAVNEPPPARAEAAAAPDAAMTLVGAPPPLSLGRGARS
ncbi:hypothetical protein [uncultured Methylobacterium sp.]|jgi:localization factor PodJL|uniref:SEL1-like repeat protein n=1 Tax=uncultured Methylobacterium sp. TaxID=157278 RepID=UPI0026262213|nr:hypothetical protein [uncultured Methylobacterium sp.]